MAQITGVSLFSVIYQGIIIPAPAGGVFSASPVNTTVYTSATGATGYKTAPRFAVVLAASQAAINAVLQADDTTLPAGATIDIIACQELAPGFNIYQ